MTPPFIHLHAIAKRFYLREPRLAQRAARLLMASWVYERKREFWALRDIDLDLKPGQTLGVIGVNGSGKSTLLKLLAGVASPTSGAIEIQGDVVGLLELGAGFHPDLTGYQNIYLQCNLLGLRKSEIDRRLPAIVEFSGLDECLDWPIKRYSSGMYARLGFSVALHAGAQIVLVDEILSVGDTEFQQRGINRMKEIQRQGDSIIVLVTHDVQLARHFCSEMIWLDQGKIVSRGEPERVVREFYDHLLPMMLEASGQINDQLLFERAIQERPATSPLRISKMEFCDESGAPIEKIQPSRPLQLAISLEVSRPLDQAVFDISLVTSEQLLVAEMRSEDLAPQLAIPAGASRLIVRLEPQLLLDEVYQATVLLYADASRAHCLDGAFRAASVQIASDPPLIKPQKLTHPHQWLVP